MTGAGKPLVVVPADAPPQMAGSGHLERLRPWAEVRLFPTAVGSPAEQLERARDADVIINSRGQVKWPGPLLEQLPKLRMITTCSIGTDAIDLEAAARLGIVVSNIPGKTAPVVAEHALGLMLAVAKRAAFQTAELKAGRWTAMPNLLLAGKTLGILGTGAIGSRLGRLARAIGMRVIAWTRHPSDQRAAELGVEYVELDELLRRSDVVSVHLKLTLQTRHLLGPHQLQLMKPGSLLVNTARGPIVDTAALVEALQSGHLGGAALDVFDQEPLPPDHPLLGCEQVVLTPHHADQTPEGQDLLNAAAVDNVIAYLKGCPQNDVTQSSTDFGPS